MEDIAPTLADGVLAILGALFVYLAALLRKWSKRVDNEYMQELLGRLTDAVEVSVRGAAQTLVPKLKAAAANGKLTDLDIERLKLDVREEAFDQLVQVDRRALETLFDREQLERRIDREIEAFVQRIKEME